MNPNFGSKKSGWIDTESGSPVKAAATVATAATATGTSEDTESSPETDAECLPEPTEGTGVTAAWCTVVCGMTT